MSGERFKLSIIEAADQSGIPAEEIYSRILRGELPGEGNIAMPGSRGSGFVNARTLERLVLEGRGRIDTGTVSASSGMRFHVYMTLPIAQAAEELCMTVREVEQLLVDQVLVGAYCFPRWVGVKHESLSAFKNSQRTAPTPDGHSTPIQNTGTALPLKPVSRIRAAYEALTGGRKA